LLGIPASYLFGVYLGWGIKGLLFGYGLGNILLCCFYHKLSYRKDWKDIADEVNEGFNEKMLR
jgi:Na+-driven multidrug efflux pump